MTNTGKQLGGGQANSTILFTHISVLVTFNELKVFMTNKDM